jgi:hypothetical protein
MGLSPHQGLSIGVVICFFPAVVISAWMCIFRDIGLRWGWIYLLLLALARVVGGSLQIASEETHSEGVSDGAAILASSGLMALILVMLKTLQTVRVSRLQRKKEV